MLMGMIPPVSVRAEETEAMEETIAVETTEIETTEAETSVSEFIEAIEEETEPMEMMEHTEPMISVEIKSQEEIFAPEKIEVDNIIAEGTCGDALTWTLDAEGTLTISGTGRFDEKWGNYQYPWYDMRSSITNVILEDGITYIPLQAFESCKNLTDITIPDSVDHIDPYAFASCENLKTVRLPAALKSIGYSCFQSCKSLEQIVIPDNVTNISEYTFASCEKLKTVHLPAALESLEHECFSRCESLEQIVIPDNVKVIPKMAFRYCYNLEQIQFPSCLEEIEENAFERCRKLTEINLPEGLTMLSKAAFSGCKGLTKVMLPDSLSILGEDSFYDCDSLKTLTIPRNVTLIWNYFVGSCNNLESVTFQGDAPKFDSSAFYNMNIVAYYPEGNSTWTSNVRGNYGGKITWVPYTPIVEPEEPSSNLHNTLASLTEVDYMAFSHIAYSNFSGYEGETVKEALEKMEPEEMKSEETSKWKSWFNEKEGIRYSDLCKHIGQWRILTDRAAANGFYAVAFENDQKEAVIAYRGSTKPWEMYTADGRYDWLIHDIPTQVFNVIFSEKGDNQYRQGLSFFVDVQKKGFDTSSIVTTGHSLGGGLANIVSARYGCKSVSMNAICILDTIYSVYYEEMAEHFNGVDTWQFMDHANGCDVFAGMYEYYWVRYSMIKPVTPYESNTELDLMTMNWFVDLMNSNILVAESLLDFFTNHSLNTYVVMGGNGDVEMTARGTPFKPANSITALISPVLSLDLGTSKKDIFNKGLSVTAGRKSFGGSGKDAINTSINNDWLIGGKDDDVLDGSWGNDEYIYYKGDGYDTIYDVAGDDKIKLLGFSDSDIIDVKDNEDPDFIIIRCNYQPIIRIYKKNRQYKDANSDTFKVWTEKTDRYTDISAAFSKTGYGNVLKVQCPVDVEILNADSEVVYTLKDGDVGSYYTEYGNFYVFEEEGGGYGKSLDLVEGYTARIVGQDAGTMKIDQWDVTDNGLSETSRSFVDVPVSAEFTATFEQTADGELVLAADTDGDGTVDAKIGYDGSVIPVKVVTIAQEYIVLQPEEQTQLSVTAQPAELADLVCWDVEKGGTEVVSVDADGNVMALKPGTAYVLATVNSGINTMVARCRVDVAQPDVQEPEKLKLDGIQLSTNKVTSELFSTDFAEFDILLMLPQNHAAVASATAFTPEHRGVAIESARFADESMARLFELIPLDDRTVAIVPTEAALTDGKAVQSKYISAVIVTVQGEEYTSEALTLTVKKTQPKLKATVAAFNNFWTFQSQKIQITGATVTGISCNDLPEWLERNDMELSLNEKVPTKGSSAKLILLVETEEWAVPAEVALAVKCSYKTPSLKLNLSSVQMAAANSDGVQLQLLSKEKNKTLEDLGVTGITAPEGYSVSNFDRDTGTFLLEKTGAVPGGKITLKVNFAGTNETLALALSVKTASVVLKPASNSITLNSGTGDSAGIDIAVAPADYRLTAPKIRLENGSKQDKLNSGELGLRYDNGRLYISTTDLTPDNAKYTLYISAEGGKEATVKISTTRVAPTLKLKASGNLDLSFPNRKVSLATTFKNYSGGNIRGIDYYVTESSGKTILNEDARVFTLTKEGADLYLRLRENASVNVKNIYTLYLTLTLADKSTLESSLKIPVKQTAVALKLSANKLTMNKTVNDKASVAVTCSTKDYDFRIPYLELTDAKGNPSDGLDVSWSDGKVHVAVNEETQFGGSYKIQISPEEGAKAVTLAVSIPTEAKSNVTGTLKVTGNLDVIRDGTALTVTPAWKNMNDAERTEELKVFCGTEDVTDLFEITKSNGSYRLARAKNAELDHNGKYTAKLAVTFSNGATAEAIGALKAKMGSAKLTLNSDSTTLFAKDKHSRIDISFASADSTLNKVARVEIKDAKLKEQFEIFDYGNGRYAIGFKDGKVPAKVTNVNLLLEAWLEGNVTAKSNVSAKVKISIVP